MECLRDYIGIKECGATAPESGLYINELPGLSMARITALAIQERPTFLQVWNTIQTRALRLFGTAVRKEFSKRVRMKNLTQSVDLGKLVDTTNITARASEWRGFVVEFNLSPTSAWQILPTAFQTAFIQELNFYSPAVVNGLTFNIFNIDTGEVLWTTTVNVVIGQNRIPVNKEFLKRRLFAAYDSTLIDSVAQMQFNLNYFPNGIYYFDYFAGSVRAFMYGAKCAKPNVPPGLPTGLNTYGLSGIFSIGCKWDTLVCNNRDLFANALWYMLGRELMVENKFSTAINRFTTIDKDEAINLFNYFDNVFKEELTQVIDGIDITCYDYCLDCNPQVEGADSAI